ncbi:hypothetical protein HG535_0G01220 [Zygotorulaspora mrakii]|uniref:Septin-type G domain-containing protein n=1 Tax=Zygotorulaspora mrakii TaxID=42260 RepID=A0A7H9B682_ZYGMR|nr:uncharacterized protein HG535_0G01220 [Zygotorulaspora mrakii]QLG74238.1 hypothetical protein HG535_0G01220 [Zygotorulaspora mrakii]
MDSPSQPPANLFRRKKENKRGITYTMLLCGPSGTGKTTFANNLLESNLFPHRYGHLDNYEISPRIRVSSPTKVVSFNSKNGIPSYMSGFDAARAELEPGITITSTSVEIGRDPTDVSDEEEENILFNLINTHGIGENLDDSLCFDEITLYLEQQFDIVLAEETRIRRNPRFEDTRVHVALYFVEPTGHGLRELDVQLMKKISRYTNVLPIISRADSFTKEELSIFRKTINEDIQRFHIPVFKFEADPDEDDLETIEENQSLSNIQPFAVVCSDLKDKNGNYIRKYTWGDILINDPNISDLNILKNVLFGSHLQEFKDTTQNLLYENYRAEKLSSVSDSRNASQDLHGSNESEESDKRHSAAPSLSNFASLVNTGHFKSSQSLALSSDLPATPELNSNKTETEDSPIRQISRSIKNENEEIIRSIKQESPRIQSNSNPDRTKLRSISETVPYVLRHERIIARQQKLEKLEAQSAKELQIRIAELEKKAHDLKLKEKLLRQRHLDQSSSSLASNTTVSRPQSQIKKEDTYTDLASIASNKNKV